MTKICSLQMKLKLALKKVRVLKRFLQLRRPTSLLPRHSVIPGPPREARGVALGSHVHLYPFVLFRPAEASL